MDLLLVRLDHIASIIVNTNRSIMRAAAAHGVADRIIWRVIPQPTERQRIGNQINAMTAANREERR